MRRREEMRRLRRELIATCHSGPDVDQLRHQILRALHRLVPVDAAFFASADPATLLFTSVVSDEIPAEPTPLFRANEIGGDDFNHFTDLARRAVPIDWLDRATGGRRLLSARYREIMAPIGLGDELRSGESCWGFLCLHRQDSPTGFGPSDEEALLGALAHIAEALRGSQAFSGLTAPASPGEVGVVLLDASLNLAGSTPPAQAWLDELGTPAERRAGWPLPVGVLAVAERLMRLDDEAATNPPATPRVRVQTPSGRWLVLHASWFAGPGPDRQIAVVMEPAGPHDLAPLILERFGLTRREGEVTRLVLQGLSTEEMAARLRITTDTVQDHLKAVFCKAGVNGRCELTVAVVGGLRPPA